MLASATTGVTARQARDERLGTSLGRLAYQGLISSAQYEAGRRFAELYHRHHLTLGMPVPHPRSLAGLMITAGIGGIIGRTGPRSGCQPA